MNDPLGLRGHLPHGVQDLLLEEAARRRRAEASLRELFSRWAYQELIPPTFEYAETLVVGADPDLQQAMYRFFDREGNTLALRADFTTQVARIIAGRLGDRPVPLRCFYVGSVFRYEETQAGRQREFTQAGAELIGANTPAADAEVVALAAAALETLGLDQFQINLGQMAVLRALTDNLPVGALPAIRQAIDRRNPAQLSAALDAAGVTGPRRALLGRLPDLVGGPEILEEALSFGGDVAKAANTLREAYLLLQAYGVSDRITLDLGEVRGMEYYTGITFRGLAPGLGWPVLSGGRYDGLVGRFGRAFPALGFGLGIERALLAQPRQTGPAPSVAPHLVVGACEHTACLALIRRLREEGFRVELDVLSHDRADLQAFVRSRGTRHALRCQDDGASWQLSDGERERAVTADELIEEMRTWNT